MVKAEHVAAHTGNNYRVRELNKEVTKLMIKENKMWRQWTKIFWLNGSDKNTKYFYSRATKRHRRDIISGIYNSDGVWISQQEAIAENFIEFYQGLITSTNSVLHEEALNLMQKLLTEEMGSTRSIETNGATESAKS